MVSIYGRYKIKFNHNFLFVSSSGLQQDTVGIEALYKLKTELTTREFRIISANNIRDGLRLIQESPKYSAVGIYWGEDSNEISSEYEAFIETFRKRSASTPLLLFSEKNITPNIPVAVLKEVSEYIYLFSETPIFIANRIYTLVHRYTENLLPPYFKTLKDFTEDGDYYWDCPGHMGGMAYLKHPVGIEFFNFFGENMMRADIGVATAEMGDYLIHTGPPKKIRRDSCTAFWGRLDVL